MKTANDKPKHGDYAESAHRTAKKMQLLGISKRRAKAGKRKEIPPSTSRPVQPGKPPNLPIFIAPSPISTLSLQTTTPILLQQPSAIPVIHPSPIPFQIRQCRSPSNPIVIVILTRGHVLAAQAHLTGCCQVASCRVSANRSSASGPASLLPRTWRRNTHKNPAIKEEKSQCRIQGVCLANR